MQTWEMIVEPDKPISLSDLDIILTEGESLNIGARRPELDAEVKRYWSQKQVGATMARAEELAKALKDGNQEQIARMQRHIGGVDPKVRLSQAAIRGNQLFLGLGSTNYMDFIGTNERSIGNSEWRSKLMNAGLYDAADPDKYFANALAICTVVHGFDIQGDPSSAYAVVGLRSDKVMIYPGVHHVFGGLVDIDESRANINLCFNAQRELGEETGIKGGELGQIQFYGIARQGPSRIPEIIGGVPVFLSREQLQQRFARSAPGKFEHDKIELIPLAQIPTFLDQYGSTMVPSGAAALTQFYQHLTRR